MNLKQAKEIYNGFANLLKSKVHLSNKDIEKIAKLRYNICKKCPSINIISNTCKVCGCYLPAKVRSKESSCPLYHWQSII